MIRLPIVAESPDASIIGHALDVLRRGGIVAYPTDTLYGLAVDPRDEAAVIRSFQELMPYGLETYQNIPTA